MDFKTYMSRRIPDFESRLSILEITELKVLFDEYINCLKIEQNTLNMSMNHNAAGIDYANDFEKASERRMIAQQTLDTAIMEKSLSLENNIEKPIVK